MDDEDDDLKIDLVWAGWSVPKATAHIFLQMC